MLGSSTPSVFQKLSSTCFAQRMPFHVVFFAPKIQHFVDSCLQMQDTHSNASNGFELRIWFQKKQPARERFLFSRCFTGVTPRQSCLDFCGVRGRWWKDETSRVQSTTGSTWTHNNIRRRRSRSTFAFETIQESWYCERLPRMLLLLARFAFFCDAFYT